MGPITGTATAARPSMIPKPVLFWSGSAAALAGVALHLPDLVASAPGFRMAGMGMSTPMLIGMVLVIAGPVLAWRGLVLPAPGGDGAARRYTVERWAGAGLRPNGHQLRLLAALFLAMTVDQMKPATLAFIEPGMRVEYGLSAPAVAVLPVVALTGTLVGSLLWGMLADRIGRRATMLMATLVFVSTTVCSAMPTFGGNVVMCFLMGASAGGLLPVTFTLLAEALPTSWRGAAMVLLGGVTAVASYLACSGMATVFLPLLGWRSLWFVQLPLPLLLLALNRWIPESPQFLALHGHLDQARLIAARFGSRLRPEAHATGSGEGRGAGALVSPVLRRRTVVIVSYGLSWGCVYWGFMTFLPTLLSEDSGVGAASSRILFFSSLVALPGTLLAAACYHRWGARRTMITYGVVTTVALAGLAACPAGDVVVLGAALVLLLLGTSGALAVIGPYTAEAFPTAVRGLAGGVGAGAGKAAGIAGPPAFGALLIAAPGWSVAALVAAVPMAGAVAVVARLDRRRDAAAPPEQAEAVAEPEEEMAS